MAAVARWCCFRPEPAALPLSKPQRWVVAQPDYCFGLGFGGHGGELGRAGRLDVLGGAEGLAAAVVIGTWLPWLVPTAVRALAAGAYRSERDQKMLEWMRKLRLLTSAGQPINAAAVNAALTISGRAFTIAQGAIGAALDAGRDPLPAVTAAIAGSPAEPLLTSVVAAERAGAASSDLLDKSLSRAVRTLESEAPPGDRSAQPGNRNHGHPWWPLSLVSSLWPP